MKVEILTDHLYKLTTSQYVDIKYKVSVKSSTFIATMYIKGLLIIKELTASLE